MSAPKIVVMLPDEASLEAIQRAAREAGVNTSAYVRTLLEKALAERGERFDLRMEWGGRRPYGVQEEVAR